MDIYEALLVVGFALVEYGLYLIAPPLCWVFAGAVLIAIGWPKRR